MKVPNPYKYVGLNLMISWLNTKSIEKFYLQNKENKAFKSLICLNDLNDISFVFVFFSKSKFSVFLLLFISTFFCDSTNWIRK